MIKMCCFVILTDKNFANNYFNVFKTISFRTLSLIGEPRDIPNISMLMDILFTFPGNYYVGEGNTRNKSISISL
jgi:hypothetical protein